MKKIVLGGATLALLAAGVAVMTHGRNKRDIT